MPKSLAEEHFSISEKFGYRKISPKTLVSLLSVEHYSHILPKKFVGEPLCVSESLGHRKLLCSVGAVSRFSVDFFGLTVLTNCVCNPFNLPENFGYRIFLCMRKEKHVLPWKFFVSQYAKNSWKPLLCFRIFGISKTFMHITVFFDFFVSQYQKTL